MYNLPATYISKSEISRIEHAWKAIMYTIDGALIWFKLILNAFPYVLQCYSGSAIL